MNEISLLRSQLAAERAHVREIATAAAATNAAQGAPEAFSESCAAYLRCVLGWFEQRDLRLAHLYARRPPDDCTRRALEAIRSEGSAREALAKLAAAVSGAPLTRGRSYEAWTQLAAFVNGAWTARRSALEALLDSSPRVADWRAVAGIDADSTLEERALYARVRDSLPAGIQLVAGSA